MKLSISEMTKLETLINKAEGTDVSVIIQMIKVKQRNDATMATGNFSVGDSVFFVNRSGQKISGVVEKVMQKNIKVSTSDGKWRVPATMLKAS